MKIQKCNVKLFLLLLLSILAIFSGSCIKLNKPIPIPKEKEAFIGIWESSSGFKIEIKSEGIATILQGASRTLPGYDPEFDLLPGRKPHVFFKGDTVLNLLDPFNYSRDFKIDLLPVKDSSGVKMILNGVTFIK
jgi:hypothetical protein